MKEKQRTSVVTSSPKSNILSRLSSKIHTLDGSLDNIFGAGCYVGFPLLSFIVWMPMKLSSLQSCICGDVRVTG